MHSQITADNSMNLFEKIYSIFAIVFAFVLIAILFIYPETRQLKILLPISLAGVIINIGLMFIVLRDIFYRNFSNPMHKYMWIAIVFIFWPAILYYLPRYGFTTRNK